MGILTWVKLKALKSALDSLSTKEIVDVIESFGKKEFGDKHEDYLDQLRLKMASVVFEIGKRIRRHYGYTSADLRQNTQHKDSPVV